MHPKSDDSTRELIHDEKGPVGLEHHGFTPEQIGAPETVLHVSDEGEPGGTIPGIWLIVLGENTSHNVLVDIDAKGPAISCAILGVPNRGFLRFISRMSWMSSKDGPLGPGFSLLFEV